LNQPLKSTVEQKRLHHQLMPMRVQCEYGYDELEVLEFLKSKGHEVQVRNPIVSGFASIVAISKRDGKLEAIVDPRRDEHYDFV
jgi:gamma-glutamyltranspeptidase